MNKADGHQVCGILPLEKVEHLVPRIYRVVPDEKNYQGIKMVYSVLHPIAIICTFAYFRFLLDFGSTCRVLRFLKCVSLICILLKLNNNNNNIYRNGYMVSTILIFKQAGSTFEFL